MEDKMNMMVKTEVMNPFTHLNGQVAKPLAWELTKLTPTPEEEWQRLRHFLELGQADLAAMAETVEPLFRRGYELVVGNYDYLLKHHETAVILGWEHGADPEHLAGPHAGPRFER
jgi:hypothetical protein